MQVMVKKNFLQCFPVNSIQFLFITNSPELASFAVASGVDRIFLDLEILGKQARQGHLDTVISRHAAADLAVLRDVVPPGRLLVRVNPVHEGTEAEIDRVIRDGADIVMLPMFHGPTEVERFCQAVAGRARTCLLVETVGAMRTLADCVRVLGVDEVHIGLNDLHLELGLRFMFEPLAEGLVDRMVQVLREASVPFGIGGVARVGEGMLPAERAAWLNRFDPVAYFSPPGAYGQRDPRADGFSRRDGKAAPCARRVRNCVAGRTGGQPSRGHPACACHRRHAAAAPPWRVCQCLTVAGGSAVGFWARAPFSA
jgi:hypothetical protein